MSNCSSLPRRRRVTRLSKDAMASTLSGPVQTTAKFCETVRWIRRKVHGVSFEELAAQGLEQGPEIVDALRAVETPGSTITNSEFQVYEYFLERIVGTNAEQVVPALATAHFADEDHASNLQAHLVERQKGALEAVMLGADLRKEAFTPVTALTAAVLPAAQSCLLGEHIAGFASCSASVALRRDGTTALAYRPAGNRLGCDAVGDSMRAGKKGYHVGIPGLTRFSALCVDPFAAVQSVSDAWCVATAMGAPPHELGALVWGLLLVGQLSRKKLQPGILLWATLDAQGPSAYNSVAQSVQACAEGLVAAPDQMWAVTRRYISPWHAHYVRGATQVRLYPSDPELTVLWDDRAQFTEQDMNCVVLFDDQALAALPEVLGCITPVLHLTDTSIGIHMGEQPPRRDHLWWLPTGIPNRLLCRPVSGGHWIPVQMAP